jgi:glycine/D-amino acid oxidase-like deaminating enzyme
VADRAVVVGGGFYGARIALLLARRAFRVALLERQHGLMTRASFVNQARVHNGYHYPRSITTGRSSHLNYERFVGEYHDCITRGSGAYYAIPHRGSKVTTAQFVEFCSRIGAPLEPAPPAISRLFNRDEIDVVFGVAEVLMNADQLRNRLSRELVAAGVEMNLGSKADAIEPEPGSGLTVVANGGQLRISADVVVNCTYSALNGLIRRSQATPVPLKHELAEISLVSAPPELQAISITVVDGPFFSVSPFPPRGGVHALTHVRYTPHYEWNESDASAFVPEDLPPQLPPSNADRMIRDAMRYLPILRNAKPVGTLWETKTVLPRNEGNDGRPILFREVEEIPGLFSVLGAKIDGIYDVEAAVSGMLASRGMGNQ